MAPSLIDPSAPHHSPSPMPATRLGRARRALLLRWVTAHGSLVIAAGVLLTIGLLVAFAPWLTPYNPLAFSAHRLSPPSLTHIMGTDEFGRDVFSRVLAGGRVTLEEAVLATLLASGVGVPLGLVGGYIGRAVGTLVMRVVDIMLAFPSLLLALIVITVVQGGTATIVIAVGVGIIPTFARLTFGATLSIKTQEYVEAARALAFRRSRIMFRHVLPNMATMLTVLVSSSIGWAILNATALNFLGFGVYPPAPSWGSDLADSLQWITSGWWMSTFYGLAITIVIVAANFLGDYAAKRVGEGWQTTGFQIGQPLRPGLGQFSVSDGGIQP